VLTPAEIAKVRESTGLSRAEFCELTRIGIASLQRWETGSLIQNAANDELLFLMSFSENVNHLRERDRDSALKISLSKTGVDASCHRGSRRFRGRCLTDDKELQRCSEEWSLRVKAA
jgi:hypothetical protein